MRASEWVRHGVRAWRMARGRRWPRYVSVVPLAQEWMAAAMGSAEGERWAAERRVSRRRAKLFAGMEGMAEDEEEDSGGGEGKVIGGTIDRRVTGTEGGREGGGGGEGRAPGGGTPNGAESQKGRGGVARAGQGCRNQCHC